MDEDFSDDEDQSYERAAYWCDACGSPRYYCGHPFEDPRDTAPPLAPGDVPAREPWGPGYH